MHLRTTRHTQEKRQIQEKNGITPEIEEKIIELRKTGATIQRIAQDLGISTGTVHRILKKKAQTSPKR